MAGHLINNENILQAITVDEQGRLYTTSGSGTASNRVQGAVLDGGSTTGLAPIVLGATNSGQVRSLTAFSQSSDGITLASAFGLEVNSVIRLLNAAGTSDRMRTAGAGTGTAGTGVLGAAPLGFSGSTYFHIYSEDGSNDASTTIPIGLVVNNRNKIWNGASWDRLKSAASTSGTTGTGLLGAGCLMLDSDDGAKFKPLHIVGASSQSLSRSLAVGSMLYNGTNVELSKTANAASGTTGTGVQGVAKLLHDPNASRYYPEQSNFEGTAIASGSYTSTQTSPAIINLNARGIMIYLDVNANPGAAETLSIDVQVICPISNAVQSILPGTVIATAANGLFIQQIYPGIVETGAVTAFIVQGVALPRLFRLRVVHSASGSWNYSLSYCFIR